MGWNHQLITHLIGSKKRRRHLFGSSLCHLGGILASRDGQTEATCDMNAAREEAKEASRMERLFGVGEAEWRERNYANIWISPMYENSHLWYMFGMSMADSMDETY